MNLFRQGFRKSSCLVLMASIFSFACQEQAPSDVVARDPRTGLTKVESAQVLAEVGDVKITLGEYAESLLRLGEYQQLRYQSKERQLELLNELIDLELFAQEAKRLKLDERPEVQIAIDQAQRDQVLLDLRNKSLKPNEVAEADVKNYYDSHRAEFKEPERRRVLAIGLKSEKGAKKLLQKVIGTDGGQWAKSVAPYLEKDPAVATGASEYSGDLGFTSQVDQRGMNANIPLPIIRAVFGIESIGDVHPSVIQDEGLFYVVKLAAISPARDRSYESAAPLIRVELARKNYLQAEEKLIQELRQRYPVTIVP